LARRAEITARPARVRMRSRKPWVLARRRLFGWNVRLLTWVPSVDATGATGQRAAATESRWRSNRAIVLGGFRPTKIGLVPLASFAELG
jgi:hypothetical protein